MDMRESFGSGSGFVFWFFNLIWIQAFGKTGSGLKLFHTPDPAPINIFTFRINQHRNRKFLKPGPTQTIWIRNPGPNSIASSV